MKLYKKYLIKEFLNAFAFSLMSFLMIRLAVEIFENLNMMLEHKVDLGTAATYFASITPYFFIQLLPLSTLMATLYTLTKMAKTQELTAFRAAGLSHLKIATPFLLCAAMISGLNLILDETVVPACNARARKIKHEDILKTQFAPGIVREHFTFKTTTGLMVYAAFFDGNLGVMDRVSILRLSPEITLEERWDADRALYDAEGWRLTQGIHRRFEDGAEQAASAFADLRFSLMDPPTEFSKPLKRLEEMNMLQAWRYIEKLKRWGAKTTVEFVYFYLKFSFPLANLILCLIGIPIAFLTGPRMGVIFSFSISVVMGFLYWSTLGVGVSLGKNGAIPPLLAAWLGNLIFGLIGGGLLYFTKK